MTQSIQVGTKGVRVVAYVVDENGQPVPLDGTPVFHFESPAGVDYEVNGTIDPVDDWLAVYVLSAGDNVGDTAGTWEWQVELDLDSGWAGLTSVGSFEAVANLS